MVLFVRVKKKCAQLLAVTIFFSCQTAFCNVVDTPEGTAIGHLASSMSLHKRIHGRVPTGWEEIQEVLDWKEETRSADRAYSYKIEERYQFLTERVPMRESEGGRVLVIRNVPFFDSGYLQRYLIYEDKDGRILKARFSEDEAQKLLERAGVRILRPPNAPAYDWPSKWKDLRPLVAIVLAVIAVAIGALALRTRH
jgi:hypothetical protein